MRKLGQTSENSEETVEIWGKMSENWNKNVQNQPKRPQESPKKLQDSPQEARREPRTTKKLSSEVPSRPKSVPKWRQKSIKID